MQDRDSAPWTEAGLREGCWSKNTCSAEEDQLGGMFRDKDVPSQGNIVQSGSSPPTCGPSISLRARSWPGMRRSRTARPRLARASLDQDHDPLRTPHFGHDLTASPACPTARPSHTKTPALFLTLL